MHGVIEISKTSGHMTEAEYDRERAKIAPTKAEAGIRWEQAFARLFVASGWTQEQLGKKEQLSRHRISQLLQFGQFLTFFENATRVANPAKLQNLNEKRFRSYWARTDKRERNNNIRFRDVAAMLESEVTRKRPISREIGRTIVAKCSGRKWQSVGDMAEAAGVPEHDVNAVLTTMCARPAYGAKAEFKKVGKEKHYRFFKQDKTVSLDELTEKLAPLIQRLEAEGKKSAVTTIPAEVRMIAALLQRLLDEWAE
jgi:transcriptional regulator with XRE-family HTH domain